MKEYKDKLQHHYGSIFEEILLQEIAAVSKYKALAGEASIINLGDTIQYMPLLLKGAIKVLRVDAQGNEVFLYHLEKGGTCAMSLACCLGNKKSEIIALAEEDCELLLIPVQYLSEWLCKYNSWKSFIFNSYHNRLEEMLSVIDSLAFMKMDERLLKYLRDKSKVLGTFDLEITHQSIAIELNTSREVISRLLKKMEHRKLVKLSRNKIHFIEL
jgi:CRP/FNR family transcriptional regulator